MRDCRCKERHEPRRIVVTGGPGAGKTAVLELVRHYFCRHVKVLPEAAGILFLGGFPRGSTDVLRRAVQRAIFYIQRELECVAEAENPAIILCDRGTVDGVAYWPPGDEGLLAAVGTSLDEQLARYDSVIHLCTPTMAAGYNHINPLRIESPHEALAIDARIAAAWERHPQQTLIEATPDFLSKAKRALERIRAELPNCCQGAITLFD